MFRGAISDIDLRLLRVFDAVVSHGGFAAAEVALNKSRSAISMDISDLEQRLGIVLCNRGSRGFSLTPHGEKIHAAIKTLFNDIDRFRDSVNDTLLNLSGKLVIAITDDLIESSGVPLSVAIREFCLTNPNVYIHIRTASNMEVIQYIVNSQADIGFAGKYRSVDSVSFTPIFQETSYAYCSVQHELYQVPDGSLDYEDVFAHDFIKVSVAEEQEPFNLLDRLKVSAEANNMSARVMLIMNGKHIGFLPVDYANRCVASRMIRPILKDRLYIRNTIYRITRPDRQISPLYRAFFSVFDARK